MVELDKIVFDFAQEVLDEFDPERARTYELTRLEQSLAETSQQVEENKARNEDAETKDLSI